MTESADRRLCIFTRAPELGRVKQRLAADLGEAGALAAHVELTRRTLARCVASSDYRSELWVAGGHPGLQHPEIANWLRCYPLALHEQTGTDLGDRMWRCLEAVLVEGGIPVLIGSDCPDIDADYVRRAFTALESADVVLGPAEDGGYGLVGLRRSAEGIFSEIPWGSAAVLETTLQRAADDGLSVSCLEQVFDVDTLADWLRYRSLSPAR